MYLGLESNLDYLEMSKNRRIEIEDDSIKNSYIRRLKKAKIILDSDEADLEAVPIEVHDVPWL
jgi:hypothetical protein